MKVHLIFLIFVIGICKLSAQDIFPTPLSPRIANYHIEAALHPGQKTITGREQLIWKNNSSVQIRELQFHLYMNGFRDLQSTFMKNIPRRLRRTLRDSRGKFGGVKIHSIILNEKYDLTSAVEFIHPDDNNEHDSTVIRIALPKPIAPHRIVTLDIQFTTRLPQIIARTGYANDFFLIGQWFPKIGVFQDGEWNCHQFHYHSEFFADFGVYEVEFTLPRQYIVGATGVLTDETESDSLQTLFFRAEDVHDFALTAWPEFLVETKKIAGTDVTLLYAPEHRGNAKRYFAAIQLIMEYLNNWLMPYPYPNLTIVDPPINGFRAAGMEYPCFMIGGSFWGVPASIRLFPEEVTIHEYSHQYFYGILASNEFEEPWLDEGFTSFATAKILDQKYGIHRSLSTFLGLDVGSLDLHRSDYLQKPNLDIVVKPAWEYQLGGYGLQAYDKPALVLKTLEGYLDQPVMDKVMKAYINTWKYRHPITQSFIDVVNEVSPENMDWFFNQALFTTNVLDYSLASISNQRIKVSEDTLRFEFQCKISVKRNGNFKFPVEIAFILEGGDTLFEKWDGQKPYKIFNLQNPRRVVAAEVDPHHKVWLDINWKNNSYTFNEENQTYWRHWLKILGIYQYELLGIAPF